MPIIINKLRSLKFNSLYRHLFLSPMNNSALYLNYIQRVHKSGPHARPIFKGPLTSSTNPVTNKPKQTLSGSKDVIAYSDEKNWDKKISEVTILCGSPSYLEISNAIYGTSVASYADPAKPLILKQTNMTDVEIPEIELDNIPRAILGGDLAYAVLSQTEEEHQNRIRIVKKKINEFKKIGIVEGSGRFRQYTCGYSGPYGTVKTSEILISNPEVAKKCEGASQYYKNMATFNFLTKVFTPGNNANATFINPETDKPQLYLDWVNRKTAEIKKGPAEEGKFLISGAYTGHVANAISFELSNGKKILLFTEAEMVKKYLVDLPEHGQVEMQAPQLEAQSHNIVSRMHDELFLSTDPESQVSGIFEEEEIQDLINDKVMASGALLYYVEHDLPNPLGAFGIALYMTCQNGLHIGPYIAENGLPAYGSNCVTLNETLYLAGGGKLKDLYTGVSEDDLTIGGGGKEFSPLFVDAYLRAIKGTIKTVYTYGGTLADYVKHRRDAKESGDTKSSKQLLEEKRRAAIDEILFGTQVPRARQVEDKGSKLQVNPDGTFGPAEEFIYLVLNAVSFLELKNRTYDVLDQYASLTVEERKQEPSEFLEMVDEVKSQTRPKNENKIVRILNDRNRVSICAAASILAHGITSGKENDEENLSISMLKGDAMFVADQVSKGNRPDISGINGKLPPRQ